MTVTASHLPAPTMPSPAAYFTVTGRIELRCDLCDWWQPFDGETAMSIMVLEVLSHHRFSCNGFGT